MLKLFTSTQPQRRWRWRRRWWRPILNTTTTNTKTIPRVVLLTHNNLHSTRRNFGSTANTTRSRAWSEPTVANNNCSHASSVTTKKRTMRSTRRETWLTCCVASAMPWCLLLRSATPALLPWARTTATHVRYGTTQVDSSSRFHSIWHLLTWW